MISELCANCFSWKTEPVSSLTLGQLFFVQCGVPSDVATLSHFIYERVRLVLSHRQHGRSSSRSIALAAEAGLERRITASIIRSLSASLLKSVLRRRRHVANAINNVCIVTVIAINIISGTNSSSWMQRQLLSRSVFTSNPVTTPIVAAAASRPKPR